MDLLTEAQNRFIDLKIMHPDHTRAWIDGLHKCQSVLMFRILIRDYPKTFYNLK